MGASSGSRMYCAELFAPVFPMAVNRSELDPDQRLQQVGVGGGVHPV